MYYLHTRNDMVRIPPDRLDEDINKVTMELAHQAFEGRMGPDQKLVVLITNLELTGDSRVVHGDGAVYKRNITKRIKDWVNYAAARTG